VGGEAGQGKDRRHDLDGHEKGFALNLQIFQGKGSHWWVR
jgi:hypothetical protein